MTIRAAVDGDLEAVVALLGELHDPPDAVADAVMWAAMLEQAGRVVLVADDGGHVAGTADLLIVPNLTRDARSWMQIENVVVALRFRRRGIGRALMDAAEQQARDADCYKIQLLSARHRDDAHQFYAALGYEARAEGLRRYLDN